MKAIVLSVIAAGILMGGAFWLSGKGGSADAGDSDDTYMAVNNVSVVDGKQLVEVKAKGGYFPARSAAKAGLPTTLRFNTSNTFDCSAAVRIQSLGISKILPRKGSTDIDLGTPAAGTLIGSCGMGMYPFEIVFES